MTSEMQRAEMAKLEGYTAVANCGGAGGFLLRDRDGEIHQLLYPSAWAALCGGTPDYLTDLNAVARVERRLNNSLDGHRYGSLLALHVLGYPGDAHHMTIDYKALARVANASAAARVECILKATEKWTTPESP